MDISISKLSLSSLFQQVGQGTRPALAPSPSVASVDDSVQVILEGLQLLAENAPPQDDAKRTDGKEKVRRAAARRALEPAKKARRAACADAAPGSARGAGATPHRAASP